jgi:2-iminobutanoate/2-iminopropanoate deaminase
MTIHATHDPAGQVSSASRYSQAVEAVPGLRWLHTSGQIGMRPDGSIPATHEEQHEQTWANVRGVLEAAGMGVEHIVRVNAYVTSLEQVPAYRVGRDAALGDSKPASTLVVVAGLVDPALVVEIEVTAAAPA